MWVRIPRKAPLGRRASRSKTLAAKESNDAVDLGIGSYLGVAQLGRASGLGPEGREFKSHLLDHMQ